ncbi:SOS response-associated peptidase [Ornithinimicrobium cryptoxanthini]|uniref:Abasic site processing protein n=1 Tax=Ornithinimicrobium cryptoxanthini TaxID=2934161 RepID=A0ABY4YK78_9MICO|nr:SOS response-associated peptidase [Ornithinimicrobium cryptoxanthini]USQ77154.1 SOS response-associated peptidase [Ornithinimicrobium cryptoxanthini]
MCGRYAATADPDELIEAFEVEVDATAETSRSVLVNPQSPPAGTPDYNMAPSKMAPVALTRVPRAAAGEQTAETDPVRQLRLLTWGLVPAWAKDPKVGLRMINARAESLLEKPAFAKAAAARRCLVPAEGWFEWQASPVARDAKGKPRKQPFFMHRGDGDQLGLAGLYEFWRDKSAADDDPAAWVVSFTIITTAAEEGLDRVHDRQPLVLERSLWQDWLDPTLTDPDEVRAMLDSPGPGRFEAYPVSTAVNATRNNGPHLLERLPDDLLEGVVNPATGEVLG